MPRSENVAIVEDVRDAESITARAAAGSLVRAPAPVIDIGSGARGRVAFEDTEDRFKQAFERKLLGPLSQIVETAGMLENQLDDLKASQVRALAVAARRQSDMLRDILAFVQLSTWGGVRARRRRMDLRLLCERLLDAVQGRHPDRAIAFASKGRVEGHWDPDLVASLLSHLVDNAIEHGAANKAVRIVLGLLDDSAVIEITSAGSILDEEVAGRLFEPFNCGPSKRADGLERLGLGLFLANEIARAHSGGIDVSSDPAKGTTFRVTLPRS